MLLIFITVQRSSGNQYSCVKWNESESIQHVPVQHHSIPCIRRMWSVNVFLFVCFSPFIGDAATGCHSFWWSRYRALFSDTVTLIPPSVIYCTPPHKSISALSTRFFLFPFFGPFTVALWLHAQGFILISSVAATDPQSPIWLMNVYLYFININLWGSSQST